MPGSFLKEDLGRSFGVLPLGAFLVLLDLDVDDCAAGEDRGVAVLGNLAERGVAGLELPMRFSWRFRGFDKGAGSARIFDRGILPGVEGTISERRTKRGILEGKKIRNVEPERDDGVLAARVADEETEEGYLDKGEAAAAGLQWAWYRLVSFCWRPRTSFPMCWFELEEGGDLAVATSDKVVEDGS